MDSEARQRWLRERRLSIGASESPAILGVCPFSSALDVWASKLGITEDTHDEESLERMRWGSLLEPIILEEYQERRGIKVERHDQTIVLKHSCFPSNPMSCTPDAYDENDCLVQVKTTSAYQADDWKEGPPLNVIVQEQHEMAVTGKEMATVVVLIGGQKLLWYDIERSNTFINALEPRLTEWWERYIKNRIQPICSGTDLSVRTLEKLHPNDSGGDVFLGNEFIDIDKRLLAIKSNMRALTEERKRLENQIKAAIGKDTYGRIRGGDVWYSWKTQERKGYTISDKTFRALRRHTR